MCVAGRAAPGPVSGVSRPRSGGLGRAAPRRAARAWPVEEGKVVLASDQVPFYTRLLVHSHYCPFAELMLLLLSEDRQGGKPICYATVRTFHG